MFVFAIETNGRTVALTKEVDRIMLDGFVNGEREEGQILRRDILQPEYWDGKSPFTARLATPLEELDYHCMNDGISESDSESIWYFYGDIVADFLKVDRDKLKANPWRVRVQQRSTPHKQRLANAGTPKD
jgi:hypothetical protein